MSSAAYSGAGEVNTPGEGAPGDAEAQDTHEGLNNFVNAFDKHAHERRAWRLCLESFLRGTVAYPGPRGAGAPARGTQADARVQDTQQDSH